MSATRLIIRLVLVALLLGIGVVVFRAWLNSKPENIIARAEKSLADGQPETARVHMQNLLDRFPDSAEGHRLMAKVLLEEARAANQPATFLRNPAAFQQLIEASRLSPDDIELKKEIISIYIAGLKPGDAIEYGQAVLDKEPDNLDALYVVTVPEVQAKSKAAQARLDKLLAATEFRRFEVLRLAADYYIRMKKPEELQAILTLAANEAAVIPADKLNALPMLEIDSMTRLFETGVRSALDATTGLTRLNQALDTFEKFPMSELPVLSQMSQKSSEMMLGLAAKFPSSADSSAAKPLRTQAQTRIDKLRALAVEKKVAGPLVFQQAAMAAFNAGDHEKCAELLAQGLVDSDKVPAAQQRDVLELHLLAARNALVMRKNAAAQPHLEKLLADKNYSGWGELLSAAVNSSEGRHEKAYQHYQAAQKQLGTILLVDMGLANSCLALGKWQEALPHLQALHKSFDSADIELKSWAALNEISNAGVHFGEFRAYLALNDWEKAKEHLSALAGTPLAMRAQTMAITYLWTKGRREEALARLADARKAAPDEIALLQLQAGFAQQAGKPADASKLIEEAAAAQPNDLPRQLLLARWQIQQQQYPAALELLGKLETQFPTEIGPQLLKAQALLQSGDTEKGIE
ncbi:MAG TPA: tetratricopeptide repeat protein, partial [Pirellulaceae bacterium]|nr:tetratricopeptide repeat protein [Pirellulaceae bacterium]